MIEEKNEKKCSGCKTLKPMSQFYKNKLVLDGHSNYCTSCTKENSKRYFQRKKEKIAKIESDNLIKMTFLSSDTIKDGSTNADNLMKILMIERMIKSISDELNDLKTNFIKTENMVS